MVTAFRERPLEKIYPYLIIDTIYTKVQEAGAVRSKGLLVALGVNGDGYREILGFRVSFAPSGNTSREQPGKDARPIFPATCSMCARKSISPRSRRT